MTLEALLAQLTGAQAQQALNVLLWRIGYGPSFHSNVEYRRDSVEEMFRALRAKLTEAQAQQVPALLLRRISETTSAYDLHDLAVILKALPVKLSEAEAQQALASVLPRFSEAKELRRFSEDTELYELQELADTLKALPVKLTEAQAQQALAPLLQQIDKTTDFTEPNLAEGFEALSEKLTAPEAQQALTVAMPSLAWAATEDAAANWARAVVILLRSATDIDETPNLVAAITYPFAAGPATEILLDAVRERHADAPTKNAGTAASLAWIAEKYPDQVRRPICPTPPRPTLKCPVAEN